jgi:transcriptional regulator with XRE-family HTH domain
LTLKEVGFKYGISPSYLSRLVGKVGGIRARRGVRRSNKWPPEKIEAMRRELLQEDKSLREIAKREGVTGERIRQLVGNLNRGHSRFEAAVEKVRLRAEAGKSDEEIASETGYAMNTVMQYRQKAGIKRPNPRKRHTIESSVSYAQLWFQEYGFVPGVADWNAALAIQVGHLERVRRLEEFSQKYGKPPTLGTIQSLFGSHPELIRQAELPQVPRGARSHGRFKVEKN